MYVNVSYGRDIWPQWGLGIPFFQNRSYFTHIVTFTTWEKHIKYLTCLSYHDISETMFVTKLGSYWPSSAWGEQLPMYCRCFLLELCIFFLFLSWHASSFYALSKSVLSFRSSHYPNSAWHWWHHSALFLLLQRLTRVQLRSNKLQSHTAHFSTVRTPSQ